MRVLVATDAWHPQVNGVVRTLTSLARSAEGLGVDVQFLSPEGFRTFPLPTYPGLRLAWPGRARDRRGASKATIPTRSTSRPKARSAIAVRAYCVRRGLPFTTSYTTRFPEYISARAPIPESWIYAALRRFHAAASVTMVATPSLMADLRQRGFANLGMWTRGVDTELFRPDRAIPLPISRARSSSASGAWRWRRTSKRSCRSTCRAPRWSSAPVRARRSSSGIPRGQFLGQIENGTLAAHRRRRRRVRVPEPHRHVRRRAARGAGERLPVAAFPVTGPKDVVARLSRWGAQRGPSRRLPRRARAFARRLSRLRAQLLVGEQRAPVHRPSAEAGRRSGDARCSVHGSRVRIERKH